MDYKFKINEFEGPLDLLLHLIKEDNLNIEDIKIEVIAEQYLNYIKAMENLNLDIASEYLVMAAELIEMKSKMLLPNETIEVTDEYEEDPREELIKRLVEYKKYKEIIEDLRTLESERREIYTKTASDMTKVVEFEEKEDESDVSLDDLIEAFNDFLKRKRADAPLNTKITKKEFSVRKRSTQILKKLSVKKKMEFTELFEEFTKGYIVVTFLSILDLSKKGKINISQDSNFNKIILNMKEGV